MSARLIVVSFLVGLLFALGLGISGMTDAGKVIGFLDLSGDWDPSLAFVMVGAIAVHMVFYRFVLRRERPLFSSAFYVPSRQDIDARLIAGAALFGVGWGLGGYCPGPGLVSSVSLVTEAVVFVVAMLGGMVSFHLVGRLLPTDESP